MSTCLYLFALVAVHDFCNHRFLLGSRQCRTEEEEPWAIAMHITHKVSKVVGIAFAFGMLVVSPVPWYIVLAILVGGFVGGVVLTQVSLLPFRRGAVGDKVIKAACFVLAVAVIVLEVAWLLSFVEVK